MRHDMLDRELRMLLLLADTQEHDIDDCCAQLGISRRNFYYYINTFRQVGFIIYKRGRSYHIDQRSPFLTRLLQLLQFTEEEAVTLRKLLDMVGQNNIVVKNLKAKLDRFYDFSILSDLESRKKNARIVNTLYEAVKQKKVVKIEGYSSPHSHSTTDRFVEPFLFLNNNNDIRCYEPLSGHCKTFRISRMNNVVLMDLKWSNEADHKQVFTDIFMFSGEEHHTVTLRLGQLAHNVFIEEHPDGQKYLTPEDDDHWLLQIEVCDYRGIGRFVLGLFEDITIVDSPEFCRYMSKKCAAIQSWVTQPEG